MSSAENRSGFAAGRQELGILFVDLVDSSVFASTLPLEAYAAYVDGFKEVALVQCGHFFECYLDGKYHRGKDYQARIVGDELVVFLRTGNPANNVYLLTLLAIFLKAAWLGVEFNRARIEREMPASEIAAGINHGAVWSTWQIDHFSHTGYAINLAKRLESRSRSGDRYQVFLSDAAFRLISPKVRNLLFGRRAVFEAKGILGQVGTRELVHTFVNPVERLAPVLAAGVQGVLKHALTMTTHSSWIHDLLQNWSESEHQRVTDEAMSLARQVLSHDADNAVALYFLAQGLGERSELPLARTALHALTTAWPQFGDGHWEYAKLLRQCGDGTAAAEAFQKATLLGVDEARQESLVSDTGSPGA